MFLRIPSRTDDGHMLNHLNQLFVLMCGFAVCTDGERTPSLLHLLMYVVRGIVCTGVFSHLCFLFNFVTDPNTLIAQIQHRNTATCFSAYS